MCSLKAALQATLLKQIACPGLKCMKVDWGSVGTSALDVNVVRSRVQKTRSLKEFDDIETLERLCALAVGPSAAEGVFHPERQPCQSFESVARNAATFLMRATANFVLLVIAAQAGII